MKRLTEGYRQEWTLRLNSIQPEKNQQVQTWHLVVCFFSRNVHPYSFLCGPVSLSARVACHQCAGSPSGTRTHTKGLLMHSCSQPPGTPLEESAVWKRPGVGVAVTACGWWRELIVGDEFWPRHGENGVTSDAHLGALVACKDRVCGPEFRWLPQAPPQSVAEAHALLLNSVAHCAGRLES